MRKALSTKDYTTLKEYADTHNIKLFIFDFNGVLDDYNSQKVDFLRDLLGASHETHLPELLLATERAYITDRSATIEQSSLEFLKTKGISVTEYQQDRLANHMFTSHLTDDAREFLDSLSIPFVIYTSLSEEQSRQSSIETRYDLVTRDDCVEQKPSILNLEQIMERFSVRAHEVCVVGDGLIDDLLPAALIGAHTILVSPYAGLLLNPTQAQPL